MNMHSDRVLAGDRVLELGGRPWLMGIVNTSPDSFSDGGRSGTLETQVELARELVDAGADILDVGGESARTGVPPVPIEEEIERVVPLLKRIASELDVIVSVDTYKPPVASAAIAAGATIVNDVSGLRDPGLAELCVIARKQCFLAEFRSRVTRVWISDDFAGIFERGQAPPD